MKMQNRERMLAKLARIQGAPRAKMREALGQNASELVASQKKYAPKDSGALAASIGYTFGSYAPDNANVRGMGNAGAGDPDLSLVVHAGDAKAWYARIVEFGTMNSRLVRNYFGRRGVEVDVGQMPAQPFFFPPYRLLKRRMKGRVTRAVKKAVKDAASS